MALKIISADERRANAGKRGSVLLAGNYGVGKTSQLYTLDAATTLALDFEGGFKSVQTWIGDSIQIESFLDACDIACLVGGPNPALSPNDLLSPAHYEAVVKQYSHIDMAKYRTVFFDSISDLSHAAWHYAKQTPRAKTERGAFDGRGAFGALAENMLLLLRHMQHCDKNVIFTAKINLIDGNWEVEIEGAKTGRELPGIVDQVVSMSFFDYRDGAYIHNPKDGKFRAFVCHRNNPWGLPAKERTLGNVEMVEEPNLGKLIAKINAPAAAEAARSLVHGKPA